ncbi:DsbC family protein [Dyella kyungheensis]|jgi:thiol:disulfide interchange protein DsbC|uniref:Thiol:disulfide interchange protein n=1 Tax=Dyella kyungheensis TaxID=1242174 RepID=A0ABS2JSB3_9GAMM|nr:DsbC family protein [Dyella kyungheensis]MBM7121715.1 DsbC family protein [Dyella kyungheensis]
MFKKWLLALCVGGLTLNACAAPDGSAAVTTGPESAIRRAVLGLVPNASIDSIRPAPMQGFYQVIASGHLVYVSSDGKYMLNGDLIDLGKKKNITDDGWSDFRKAELAKVPAADRIVFSPANPKYRVTVFTDVNCAYCRQLHEHMADFNKAGIAVEYVAWPREGVTNESGKTTPTYNEMVSVWCASDRKAAFTAAKQGKAPKATNCPNPVKDEFELGVKLGVSGTPAIIGDNGAMLGGYMTPDQLLQALKAGS